MRFIAVDRISTCGAIDAIKLDGAACEQTLARPRQDGWLTRNRSARTSTFAGTASARFCCLRSAEANDDDGHRSMDDCPYHNTAQWKAA